jgi:hypothetical protein
VSGDPEPVKLPTPPDADGGGDGANTPRGRESEPPRAAVPSRDQATWIGISLVVMSLQYSIRQLARDIAHLKRVSPRSAHERAAQQVRVSRLEADVRALREQLAQEAGPQQQQPANADGAADTVAATGVEKAERAGNGAVGGDAGSGAGGGQKWTLEAWNRLNGRRIRLPPTLTSQVDLMDCLARRLYEHIVWNLSLPRLHPQFSLAHYAPLCSAVLLKMSHFLLSC